MSSKRTRPATGDYKMLLSPEDLRELLQTLKDAGVNSFAYEDAQVRLEIGRGDVCCCTEGEPEDSHQQKA